MKSLNDLFKEVYLETIHEVFGGAPRFSLLSDRRVYYVEQYKDLITRDEVGNLVK